MDEPARDDPTFGTDPWGTSGIAGDPAAAAAQAEDWQRALAGVDELLDMLLADRAEARRLQEVVRRLEARVYALERELATRRERQAEVADRLDRVLEEMATWRASEQ